MAISYPLALPTAGGIRKIRWRPRDVAAFTQGKFSGAQKVYEWGAQWWEADVELPPLKRADAEAWNVFRLKLSGVVGTFLLGDPAAATPRGSAAQTPGTPRVNGGSQTGNTLAIDGLPNSATGYLLAGDMVQLGTGISSRLYKVLDDVDTNSSGEATLTLWPRLRISPNDDDVVTVANTVGLFRLSGQNMEWDADEAGLYGIAFSVLEAL